MSMAPVAAAASVSQGASGATKSKIQSIASPGPAMKPSSDIDLFTTTLPLISRPPSHRTCLPQRRLLLCHGLVPAVRSDDVTGARASSARQGTGTARPVAVQQLPNLAAGPDGTPVTAEFVIGAYHQLFQIEKSFRMAKSDLQARPIYHHKRDPIEAHLTIVFAALAVSRWIEHQTGWSIRRFVRTARRYRTIEIQAGPHLITAAHPLPDDLRQALAAITSPCP